MEICVYNFVNITCNAIFDFIYTYLICINIHGYILIQILVTLYNKVL